MRFEGTVKSWNDERGFGFIEPSQGGEEVFFHIKACPPNAGRPTLGEAVTFGIELGPKGKKRATLVRLARAERAAVRRNPASSPAPWGTASYLAIVAFFAAYLVASVFGRIPQWLALVYLGASVVCFAAYYLDKSAAVAKRWRTPESTLLVLGLLGGWPGAILAQQWLRHKSSKASFRSQFWTTVLLNVAAFAFICWRWFPAAH